MKPLKFLTLFCIFTSALLSESDLRIIKDINGREISAYVLFTDDMSVTIKRASDGQVFTIPFKKLSKEDFDYYKSIEKKPLDPSKCLIFVNYLKRNSNLDEQSENESSTAFFASEGGKYYVYTAQHCLGNLDSIILRDFDGKKITIPNIIEVSNSQDIARFQVYPRECFKIGHSPSLNDPIRVYGNSDATSVMTVEEGIVNGIGRLEIEYDAKTVQGNSGSPILNENNEVIGVVAYAKTGEEGTLNSDTRYKEARRFAIMPSVINDWVKVRKAEYESMMDDLSFISNKLNHYYYVFYLITSGESLVSTYNQFPSNLAEIIRRHNRNMKNPDYKTTTNYDLRAGYTTQTKSTAGNKRAQSRNHLRSLLAIINEECSDSNLLRISDDIYIKYLRNNNYGSSLKNLRDDINWLKNEINNQIELSDKTR